MAQTKKKRRRKHRGTQGGSINTTRRAARPQSRAEARNRARSKRTSTRPQSRQDRPPTWRGAVIRGLIAAVIFVVFLALIMGRSFGSSLALGAFMLAFYIPAGYFIDRAMWRRRERARIRGKG
jgi:hypothetical protein